MSSLRTNTLVSLRWILLLLGSTPALLAAVLGVPGQYPSIQAAFDASASGDTVLVEQGLYVENLTAPAHGITLTSHYPATRDSADWLGTVLDGGRTGTCLFIGNTNGEWVRVHGLVIQHGLADGVAAGIASEDSTRLELDYVKFFDHQTTGTQSNLGASSVVRLRRLAQGANFRHVYVRNTVGDDRPLFYLDCRRNVVLDSLHFEGTGDLGNPGRFVSSDSLWASNLLMHDYPPTLSYNSLHGRDFTYIRDIEIYNMTTVDGLIMDLGGGLHNTVRNVWIHDCHDTGPYGANATAFMDIGGAILDVDSLIFENCSMLEKDMLQIVRQGPSGGPIMPIGNVNHLTVRNNYTGGPVPGRSGQGRVTKISFCNLRNSLFTGNTSEFPDSVLLQFVLLEGSTLHMFHHNTDSLFIENVEFSHNVVIDHDNYDDLLHSVGPEFIVANFGRALYLIVNNAGPTTMRNCVFHDNRQANSTPETDWWYSLGSTVHLNDASTFESPPSHFIVEDCSFTDNDDGGFRSAGYCRLKMRNCVFRNNKRFALYAVGELLDIANVWIDSTVADDNMNLLGSPSRQCAITTEFVDPQSSFRNITIRGCDVQSLFAGNLGFWGARTHFHNFVVYGNVFENLYGSWLDPEYNGDIVFSNCLLPEIPPEDGGGNLYGLDPLFDPELGAPWLSPESPCIDAGSLAVTQQDREDPDNPGFALWPSYGTLHNDIGYTGGPNAGTLDHLVAVRKPVTNPPARPVAFTLHPAYPNPFNPSTTVSYTLARPMQVELSVYNLLGQKARTLAFGLQDAGEHSLYFTAGELASGMYVVELKAGGHTQTRKVLLLK